MSGPVSGTVSGAVSGTVRAVPGVRRSEVRR